MFHPCPSTEETARQRSTVSMESLPSQINLPRSLEASRIRALPPAAYYIPDFISEEEEAAILHKVA